MGDDKGKQLEDSASVCNSPTKEAKFDLEHARETFMQEKKNFAKASTSESWNHHVQEIDPSMLTTFLETFMNLLRDSKVVKGLQELTNRCVENNLGELHAVWKIRNHKARIGHEMRLVVQIGEYEMDLVILDLGSDVNISLKQTWEWMGRPMLQWSPIQLRMENQQKIIPMGYLWGVIIDIEGASALDDFEVIEILDERNSYPVLLGIDWATNMNGVINLKKRKMRFENKSLCVIVPLDPAEGSCYTEPVRDYESDDNLDYIYKITT